MNPYQAPAVSEDLPLQSKSGKALAITGAFLQLIPLAGFIVVIIGMKRAFSELGNTANDVGALGGHIGEVLVATSIGFCGSLGGLGLFFLGLIKFRYRAVWCFWFLLIYGILSLLAFPIGTLIGIGLLIYAGCKRKEFLNQQEYTLSL